MQNRKNSNFTVDGYTKNIKNFLFIWITDGQGWKNAKSNLKEIFNEMENIYNINDLENGIISKIIK